MITGMRLREFFARLAPATIGLSLATVVWPMRKTELMRW